MFRYAEKVCPVEESELRRSLRRCPRPMKSIPAFQNEDIEEKSASTYQTSTIGRGLTAAVIFTATFPMESTSVPKDEK